MYLLAAGDFNASTFSRASRSHAGIDAKSGFSTGFGADVVSRDVSLVLPL